MATVSWGEVVRALRISWRDLALTDLLYKLAAFVVLAPAVALLVRVLLRLQGSTALSDTELIGLLLRPLGWITLVAIGGAGLGLVALAQSGLMAIALGVTTGVPVDYRDAFATTARRAGAVLGLTARIVASSLLLLAPFLAALGLLYIGLLGGHDINYYLHERPPEFLAAAALGALVATVAAVVLVRRLLGWALALPLVLFDGMRPAAALSESQARCRRRKRVIAGSLIGWGGGCLALSLLVSAGLQLAGRSLVMRPGQALEVTLIWLASWALAALVINWTVTLACAASFAVLVVGLYTTSAPAARESAEGLAGSARFRVSRPAAVGVGLVAAVVAIAGGLAMLEDVWAADRATVTAHRGASAEAPENTLAAIERALDAGADWVEIDVQETADGEVVVIHDSDLMKIGATDLKIWDATLGDLAAIDVGSWFAPGFSSERVPTLAAALEMCRGRAGVNIELKYYGHDQNLEERVIEIVERLGMAEQVVIMSLERAGVAKVRALRPDWKIGLLAAVSLGDLTRVDVDFLAVSAKMATLDFVRRAHAADKEVYVWTVNDAVSMSNMLGVGVDSIITDEPALLRMVIAARAEMDAAERVLLALGRLFGRPHEAELAQ